MIYGIGHDVLEIRRMKDILAKASGGKFIRRILTPAELQLAEGRTGRLPEFVSGRFAAKEAVVKALGCGIGSEVGFQDIEILPDSSGKPGVKLTEGPGRGWVWTGKRISFILLLPTARSWLQPLRYWSGLAERCEGQGT